MDSVVKNDKMENVENKYKKGRYKKDKLFFMLVFFLWAGMATPLVKFYSSEFPFILVINLLFLFYFYIKYKSNKIKKLFHFWGILILWYALICLKYSGIQKTDFTLFYSALIAFVGIGIFPKIREFFLYYEKVLIFLCLLSLIVWGSVSIFPAMAKVYDALAIYKTDGIVNSSFILVGYGHQMVGVFHRNLGFAWEAGRFASFIVFGIFINLHNHNLDINFIKNRSLWILIITLITTFSTTGFVVLAGVLLFYFYNKSVYSKIILLIIGLLIFPSVIALPFIGDKILENLDYNQEIDNMLFSFTEWGTISITPQRITGFYLEIQNFLHDPLLGYNINENSYMMKNLFKGFDVWLSDGILQIFSKYGLIIGLYFYYNLFRTSSYVSKVYQMKGKYFLALVFILMSFSYDFWGTGLFFYITFYKFFNSKKGYNNESRSYCNNCCIQCRGND